MNLQTEMARGAANRATAAWSAHQRGCYQCKHRNYCPAGTGLRDAALEARVTLRRNIELDNGPIPGQDPLPLFDQET